MPVGLLEDNLAAEDVEKRKSTAALEKRHAAKPQELALAREDHLKKLALAREDHLKKWSTELKALRREVKSDDAKSKSSGVGVGVISFEVCSLSLASFFVGAKQRNPSSGSLLATFRSTSRNVAHM